MDFKAGTEADLAVLKLVTEEFFLGRERVACLAGTPLLRDTAVSIDLCEVDDSVVTGLLSPFWGLLR